MQGWDGAMQTIKVEMSSNLWRVKLYSFWLLPTPTRSPNFVSDLQSVSFTVCGRGRWCGGEDLSSHLIHHKQVPFRVCSYGELISSLTRQTNCSWSILPTVSWSCTQQITSLQSIFLPSVSLFKKASDMLIQNNTALPFMLSKRRKFADPVLSDWIYKVS